jgi:hypothetical protein
MCARRGIELVEFALVSRSHLEDLRAIRRPICGSAPSRVKAEAKISVSLETAGWGG